ncbi:MAG: MFS transporter [Alphaproteobacteria bacterium]|nr:MAG: MFS transporter [Alphaproteobacteria bacterium]
MLGKNGTSRPQAFYGWYVVHAIGLVLMTTSGLAFYNLSVLLDAFVAERGFPVALTSGATASFFIASGAGGVFAARLMDRIDARLIMIFGACVSAIALGALSLLQRPWQLYAFHLLFGFCYGFCGLVPATTIVARWFEARRALALSIASTGLSLGGVLVTPLAALLIQRRGIAGAAPWLGLAFFLGVVPVTAWIVRSSPQEMGLVPDGAKFAQRSASAALARHVPYAQARRSRFFIAVTAAYLFGLGAQVGAITHLFRLASTRASPGIAALALALMASASVVGRLAGGWLLLKLPARGFAIGMLLAQAVALALLAFAAKSLLLAGAVLFGITVGNVLMLQPLLLAEAFGTRHYGRIYSVSNLIAAAGVAGGPALIGVLYEASGGYTLPYLVVSAASVLSCAILLLAGRTQDERA